MNPVLKTTLWIVKTSKDVKIDYQAIDRFIENTKSNDFTIPSWPKELHFSSPKEDELLVYLIILDALNFCFWPKKSKVKYKNKIYSGYFVLSISLKKFFESINNITFKNLKKIRFVEFKKFFKKLSLAEKRYEVFKKVCEFMDKKYPNPVKLILNSNKSTKTLLRKIYTEIPYFDDIQIYNKKKIYFLKKAQILIADIYGAFEGKGLGDFKDMDYLTCFADYKIPQILNHFGILQYSPYLSEKISKGKLIKKGSKEEIEIRANTIWAVEFIKEKLKTKGIFLKSFELDWYLWNLAKKEKLKAKHHKTITVFY